jgi:hypothetical protein
MPPDRLIEPAYPPAPPRSTDPPDVPSLGGTAESLERIDRHLRGARRSRMTLALLAVSLGRAHTPDGVPVPHAPPALAREFSRRLRTRIRGTDDLWRCAEDEWVAVLHGCRSEGARLARLRLVRALAEPFRLDGVLLCCSPRIGLAGLACLTGAGGPCTPVDEVESAGALLARAQSALDFDPPPELRRVV